jgi:hypothetical protein
MRVVSRRPDSAEHPNAPPRSARDLVDPACAMAHSFLAGSCRTMRYLRFGSRLALGLMLGAVLGPPLQRVLAALSFRFVVPLALASAAGGLLSLAITRTVRDLRGTRHGLRDD